jgi:hypothetical protein
VDKDEESAGKLVQAVLSIPPFGIEVSIIFYLQTIIAVHSEQALLKTLMTKVCPFFCRKWINRIFLEISVWICCCLFDFEKSQ